MFGLIFLPFIIINFYIPFGHPRINIHFSNLLFIPEVKDIKWSVLISTAVWSLGGYDYVGSIAGEVKGGKRAFIIGIIATFPLNIINYAYPIILTYIVDGNDAHWQSGYFTQLTRNYFPYWLGIMMVVSSILANFTATASMMAQLSWTVWAMGKGRKDDTAKHRFLPYFMSWSWRGNETTQPLMALIVICFVVIGISAFDYNTLSQIYLPFRSLNVLCEYAALIGLKFSQPNRPRPFKIPGGGFGAILLAAPTAGIVIFCLSQSDIFPLEVAAAVIAFIILLLPLKKIWVYTTHRVYVVLSDLLQ
jgi:amino acid transporter